MRGYTVSAGAGRGRWPVIGGLVVALVLAVLVAVGVGHLRVNEERPVVVPEVVLTQTAGTTVEADVVLPGQVRNLITTVADGNGRLVWVKTDGNGTAKTDTIDLTPRTSKGDAVNVPQKRKAWITARIDQLLVDLNAFDTTVPGRSMLGALQNVPPGTSDVVVVSLGLDTTDPTDARVLAFDTPVADVVKMLTTAGEVPRNLAGRTVWFVWSQPAGAQEALRQPQAVFREELATGIVTAAGGKVGGFLDAGAGDPGSGGDAPVVPIPPAPGTLHPTVTTGPATTGTGGKATSRTCVLPTQVLFQVNTDELVDAVAARNAVGECLGGTVVPGTAVALVGHTACSSLPDDADVKMTLSKARAERIKTIVVGLGVPAAAVTTSGVGSTHPLRQPCGDPGNRAVELAAVIPVT